MRADTVRVFEYEYFDADSGWWRRGVRPATAQRIAKLGGVLIASTGTLVPAHHVGLDGFACLPQPEPEPEELD